MRGLAAHRGGRQRAPEPAQPEWMRSRLRLCGVAVLCAKICLVPLAFDPSSDFPFVVPKAILSHVLAYLLAAFMAGLVVRFGRDFYVWSPLHVPVVAFLVVNIAATILAVNHSLALYGTHARMLGLGTIADWVALYFAVVLLVRTRAEAAAVISCGLGASLVILLYELVQLAGKDPFPWTFVGEVNPFSTLGQPTTLALYLSIVAVGAFTLGVVLDGLRWPSRVALVLFATVLLAGAAATGTRSSALGIAAGTAVLLVIIWVARPSRRARATSLLTAAGAIASLVAILAFSPAGSRLATTVSALVDEDSEGDLLLRLEPSAAARVALYAIGFEMVRERPALGYGPDNFVVGVPKYRTASEPKEIQSSLASSAHSWVGFVTTGSGLIGLGAFVAVVAIALRLALRGGARPVTMASTAMLCAFLAGGLTTVSDIGTDWLFWANAGAIAAVTARAKPTATTARASPSSRRRGRSGDKHTRSPWNAKDLAAVFCVVVGVLISLSAMTALGASRDARLSKDLRVSGRMPQAIELAARATRADPGRPEYWHALGIAYVGASRWADASAAFERASKLAPYDVRHIDDMATAQLLLANAGETGARARAIGLADRAVQTDPNNPRAQLTRAVVMQVSGNLPEALRSIERAVALDPTSASAKPWVTAAQINVDSGRPSEAVRFARQGIEILGPSPASIPLRYELARALVAIGQARDALAELDFALSIQPYAPAERLRAEVRAQLGN